MRLIKKAERLLSIIEKQRYKYSMPLEYKEAPRKTLELTKEYLKRPSKKLAYKIYSENEDVFSAKQWAKDDGKEYIGKLINIIESVVNSVILDIVIQPWQSYPYDSSSQRKWAIKLLREVNIK
jgi:hypothetical protein